MTLEPDGALVTITPDPWTQDGPTEGDDRTTWRALDLTPYITGEAEEEEPTALRRTDEAALLYAGRVNSIIGETESGKSWLACEAARQEITAGRSVLYLDFEDSVARIVGRLLALGTEPDALSAGLRYVSPQERLSPQGSVDLFEAQDGVSLVVIDGVTEAMAREGLELTDNSDVQRWCDRLPRPLAQAGPAVVTVDHVVKSREARGRYALGGQHKLAAVDGAAYVLETVLPFGRGRDGLVRLKVAKDRPGAVRGLPDGGNAEIRVGSDGQHVAIEVAPSPSRDEGTFRPTVLMERVSETLEAAEGGLSLRAILDGVRGKQDVIRLAVDVLREEGHVRVEPGPRGAHMHYSTKPYRQADEGSP